MTTPQKATSSALFQNQKPHLFVPTEDMWQVHEAAKPKSVLKRAGLEWRLWYDWQGRFGKEHWLFAWLYRTQEPPASIELVYPSTVKVLSRKARDNEFFLEPEMMAFRDQTTTRSLASAVISNKTGKPLTNGFLRCLKRHADADWLRGWLLRAETAPADVVIATTTQIQRCRDAWDYRAFLRDLEMDGNTYRSWFESVFPRENLPDWIEWLYGAPVPKGWFVPPESFHEVKRRLSPAGIAEAAEVSGRYRNWLDDEAIWSAVEDACESASYRRPPVDSEAWTALDSEPAMQRAILQFAAASTMQQALRDLCLSEGWWDNCRRKALKAAGEKAANALSEYLKGRGRNQYRCGILTKGLFLAPPSMLAFRKLAKHTGSEQRIPEIKSSLPSQAFREWMLDWTVPSGKTRDLLNKPKAATVTAKIAKADSPAKAEIDRKPEDRTDKDWFDSPPPKDCQFQHGPVEGTIKELSLWIGPKRRALKNNNGSGWWIQEIHRYRYAAWFTTQSRYAQVNQKKIIAQSGTTSNDGGAP